MIRRERVITKDTASRVDVGTTINALLMAIIGGSGTLIGPLLGAGVLQLLGYLLNLWLGSIWQLVFGLIHVLLVLFLPFRLVGTWRAAWKERLGQWSTMVAHK